MVNQIIFLKLRTGANLGTVLALPISGVIASEWGWEYVFYLFGSMTLVWLIFWVLFISSSPAEHGSLTQVSWPMWIIKFQFQIVFFDLWLNFLSWIFFSLRGYYSSVYLNNWLEEDKSHLSFATQGKNRQRCNPKGQVTIDLWWHFLPRHMAPIINLEPFTF